MGETGCGKTRLIKFLCNLWKPVGAEVQNMILMKVLPFINLLTVVSIFFPQNNTVVLVLLVLLRFHLISIHIRIQKRKSLHMKLVYCLFSY